MSTATHTLRTDSRESSLVRATVAQPAATPRREYRERDFGIGYGNSSGYRGKANYTRAWRPSLFKFN